MKVYRFVTENENLYGNIRNGYQNESLNLTHHGLISPTSNYLQIKPDFLDDRANTFGKENVMTKYFFASLCETLLCAYLLYMEDLELGYVFRYKIMEVDIPNELLKECIGLGFYSKNFSFTEFRIAYKDLYEAIGKDKKKYFNSLLDFYNKNIDVSFLHRTREYQKYKELLEKESIENIFGYDRLSIYPLFCFEPNNMDVLLEKISLNDTLDMFQEFGQMALNLRDYRDQECGFNYVVDDIAGINDGEIWLNKRDVKEELFEFINPILEEENNNFKRILKK